MDGAMRARARMRAARDDDGASMDVETTTARCGDAWEGSRAVTRADAKREGRGGEGGSGNGNFDFF